MVVNISRSLTNAYAHKIVPAIKKVIVYAGHQQSSYFGPYHENIEKRIKMFNYLNQYRQVNGKALWSVASVPGEELVDVLKKENPEETLLVIPAGQSTRLDKVFSVKETTFLKEEFFWKGGRGYCNCGSAYWVSSRRVYTDVCEEQPTKRATLEKISNLPLFEGVSEGPLCRYPGDKYKVGFFSDAVTVSDGQNQCSILLSGGGTFVPQGISESGQRVRVLVRYLRSELIRLGKKPEECPKWENAAILVSAKQGAILLSMFHPYYCPKDINAELYEKTFPDSGTNWQLVHQKLSSLHTRMDFVFRSMLEPLERMEFSTHNLQ